MDISILIDNIKLNMRVGIIFKYHDMVLLEIPRVDDGNSVIPGGRIKIDELRCSAIKREIKEELGFVLQDEKIFFRETMEQFFEIDGVKYHEFFFIYEYKMDDNDYQELSMIKENQDSHKTDYRFVKYDEFDKYNLLPMELRNIIKNK